MGLERLLARRIAETPPVVLLETAVMQAEGEHEVLLQAFADLLRGGPVHGPCGSPLADATDALKRLFALDFVIPVTASPYPVGSLEACLRAVRAALAADDAVEIFARLDGVRAFCDQRLAPGAKLEPFHTVLACQLLRRFAALLARLSSPERIRLAAGCFKGGLGPYLTRAGTLLPRPADLIGLAATNGKRVPEALGLLCTWLAPVQLHAVIEEAGDLGWGEALPFLLDAAEQAAIEGHYGAVWTLRDAAIDGGNMTLAVAAQAIAAERRPDVAIEAIVLGDLHATMGSTAEAQNAYRHALRSDPARARERLALLREAPERLVVPAGFGSDEARRWRRLATRLRRERTLTARARCHERG